MYFNRFVSSDGLLEDAIAREDDDPIGFKLSDFTPGTGEIISNEDTDDILRALGEKYCTGDPNNSPESTAQFKVRRGGVGNFYPGHWIK